MGRGSLSLEIIHRRGGKNQERRSLSDPSVERLPREAEGVVLIERGKKWRGLSSMQELVSVVHAKKASGKEDSRIFASATPYWEEDCKSLIKEKKRTLLDDRYRIVLRIGWRKRKKFHTIYVGGGGESVF